MDIPYEKQFHFRDGTSIATLEELKRKIESVSYQEFYHHVNSEKNDFAAWIRHVLKEESLADELQRVTSIVETVEIINDFLNPRPVETPHTDAQSQIEQGILESTLPPVNEPLTIEQVPTITPLAGETDKGSTEVLIEEPQVKEELFRDPAPDGDRDTRTNAAQDAKSAEPKAHEMSQFIAKEFILGIFIGLIIGLILGRMISF